MSFGVRCKLSFLLLCCIPIAANATGLEIKHVGIDKKVFAPAKGEKTTLSFELTEPAATEIVFYDRCANRVKTFAISEAQAGKQTITWEGPDEKGNPVQDGVFLYVIIATGKDGQKAVYNQAQETGGLEVKAIEYTLDRDKGVIEYILPKACMVRIRAGLKDGMFAGTILDFKPNTAGRHTLAWDGRDESGLMQLLKNPDLQLKLSCYTLPSNTVIILDDIKPCDGLQKFDRNKQQDIWATKGKYFHYGHDPRFCRSPKFSVSFPSATIVRDPNTPVVKGAVPIKVALAPEDAGYLTNSRFEIMLFVDGVFVYEIEEGMTPFTFNWDTKRINKGTHVVTVNLMSYDDHIAVVSKKIILGE